MIYNKNDILESFYTAIGSGVIKFVDSNETDRFIKDAFKECYPQYHTKMVMEKTFTGETEYDQIIEIPKSVKVIAEIELLKDSNTTRNLDIRMTDWDLLPEISGAETRAIKMHRKLPAGTIRLYAQGILDYYKEEEIDVPSIVPIVQCMAMFFYGKMKAEAARLRDKPAYVIYEACKRDAYRDYNGSLKINVMEPMIVKYSKDKKRTIIANRHYAHAVQVLWS